MREHSDSSVDEGDGMMQSRPLVSILTPSFNQCRWLRDNLRSVQSQTYDRIEHIVRDGGSSDGSVQLLGDAGPNVRWQSRPDRGQSHALNMAFEASRGDVIGWLNSDDAYFSPVTVERAVSFLEEHPEVAVVYGHAALVNGEGLLLQYLWVPPFNRRLFRLYNFTFQPAVFIRRSALGDRFVDESYDYTMDRELWLRLARRHRFARLDEVLAIDRHHPFRKSYTQVDTLHADTARLRRDYGIPAGRGATAAAKPWKVLFRVMGIRLVLRHSVDTAFERRDEPRWRLLLRQLAVPRASMPN